MGATDGSVKCINRDWKVVLTFFQSGIFMCEIILTVKLTSETSYINQITNISILL
jgi:hypothetical protein